MAARKDEKDATHFRSRRLESINGKWFFRTRESNKLQGPYDNKAQAEKAADVYAKDMQEGKTEFDARSHQYINKAFSLKK